MRELLERDDAPVIALGGGALTSEATTALLRERALCVWLDVPVATCWRRVDGAPGARPLAGDAAAFEQLHARREPLYRASRRRDRRRRGLARRSGRPRSRSRSGRGPASPSRRCGRGRSRSWIARSRSTARRVAVVVELEGGEEAKSLPSLERLWRALAERELERGDVIVCAGGGSITDVGGFAAATFRRGVPWLAVPSTLVGQVDAAIGGKTAINVAAKNDVGAFWQPRAVLCDPSLLETLPPREWAGGMAEVVKTALLAGGRLWELVEGWEPGLGERGGAHRARAALRRA